ncbi:MAG: DUF1481 domain-containing protein [Arsenophonus sp.]
MIVNKKRSNKVDKLKIFRGDIKHILLIWRSLIILNIIMLLSSCTSKPKISRFSASSFFSNDGAIRLWRLNDQKNNPQAIITIYSSNEGNNTTITFLKYRKGKLWQIFYEAFKYKDKEKQHIRFDKNNHIVFMQRIVNNNKLFLTNDDIIRWHYESDRLINLSTTLIDSNVNLYQGYWRKGQIVTCTGEKRNISFSSQSENLIRYRLRTDGDDLNIAWLETSEGNKLLLVTNENLCLWSPIKNNV